MKVYLILLSIFLSACGTETVYECRNRCSNEFLGCIVITNNSLDRTNFLANVLVCQTLNNNCFTKCGYASSRNSSSSSNSR